MTIAISPPAGYSTSPLRSSPLSGPPIQPGGRRSSGKIAIPRKASHHAHSPSSPLASHHSPHHQHAHPPHQAHASPSSSPLSRSHPLLGSYPLSLLHARMATHKSHCASQFALRVRAIATRSGPGQGPRAPTPLVLPFSATYYDLVGEDEPCATSLPSHSPWVADVDLEAHYFAQYAGGDAESNDGGRTEPPAYPGYRIPQIGQLQLLIKTPTTAVHAFVVPYDLSSLAPGARLLARERTYVAAGSSPSPSPGPSTSSRGDATPSQRESLRYAVQLQFACVPDDTGRGPGVAYYLGRTLKLVFTSSPPESGSAVRTERADEVVPPSTPAGAKHTMRGSALRKSISSASPLPLARPPSPSLPSPSQAAPSLTQSPSVTPSPSPSTPPPISPLTPLTPPSPPSAPSRRRSSIEASTEWAAVRAQWRMRAAKAAAVARGFDPPLSRPVSPVPVAPSPRSLLSALAPDAGERAASPSERGERRRALVRSGGERPELVRSGSERSEMSRSASGERGRSGDSAENGQPVSRDSTTSRTPSVASSARRRLSREERELSAKLRAMDLGDGCAQLGGGRA